jgi:predicted choloylglycine hydrolase
MRRSRLLFAALLLAPLALLPALVSAAPDAPFRFPAKKLETKGELKYVQDLPVLFVEGTPQEIGEQVGRLGVKPGQKICDYPRDYLKRTKLDFLWPSLLKEGEKMVRQFPADYRTELEAIVQASGIERDCLVAGNTMFDLKKMLACSALIVEADRSATKGPLLGRNLDYPSLGYAEQYSLVTLYRPKGKRAFVSIGFPGLVGCLSGMNDAGLALGVLEIFAVKDPAERFDPSGIPYALCYRRLLEECATVDEAEKLLRSMKRVTITCLAIADQNGGAVFEVTARSVVRRKSNEGFCICTNHFCTEQLKPATPVNLSRSYQRFEVLDRVRELPKTSRLGVADLHDYLHQVNMGTLTLQTMVFEPANLRLHLSMGMSPASAAEKLTVLELGPLFKDGPTAK